MGSGVCPARKFRVGVRYRRGVESDTLVCLNPASAAGRTGRERQVILDAIESKLGPVDYEVTRGAGDAERIAAQARRTGRARLLVAGGDGTINEVASGLLGEDGGDGPAPALGLLPLGSGWDLARSLALPRALEAALDVIAGGETRQIDAGRAVVRSPDGAPQERFFVNEASAGLSGDTIQVVGRFAKRVGARAGFAFGAVAAILGHRPLDASVEVDGERLYEGPISLVVAANGRCFGAGMQVAPEARLDDGRLELVLVRGLSVPSLLANLPSLFAGTHGRHPAVSFHAARSVSIEPKGRALYADLDGESVGTLPLRAEILPGALEVFAGPDAGAPA